jgi:hypothetical protein
MQATTNTRTSGVAVLDRLGIVEDPLIGADPVSFLRSLAAAATALAKNPVGTAAANARMALGLAAATLLVRSLRRKATSGLRTWPTPRTRCTSSSSSSIS